MTATDTESDWKTLPEDLWAAIELTPTCLTLRRALVDRLLEEGDELGSEAIRWSLEKERSPHREATYVAWCYKGTASSLPNLLLGELSESPKAINWIYEGICKSSPYSAAFMRLVWGWKRLTEKQRAALWQWTPPETSP